MLKYILNPITIDSFVNEYWDKAPFYIHRESPTYYDNILTIEQVNEYLSRSDIRFPSVAVAKDGFEIPLSEYSTVLSIGKYASEGLIDIDTLFDKFNNGASIFLQRMRSSINSLATFVSSLEKELKFRVETHIFLTPDNSQALSEHYDTTSSFIMQIYGSKTWIVSEPTLELPLVDQIFNNSTYKGSQKIFEVTFNPGDLLFLPRGFIHQAKTSNEMSMHITSVLYPNTWLDIFNTLIENLKNDREFRKSATRSISPEIVNDDFLKLKMKIANTANYQNIVQSLNEMSQSKQVKDNSDRTFDYLNISKISIESTLGKRGNINFNIVQIGNVASLIFYDKKIDFPIFILEVLNYITERDSFIIKDISQRLDESGKLVFVRKLIKEGFLKIISL